MECELKTRIERDGFCVESGVLPRPAIERLLGILAASGESGGESKRRGGQRNLLDLPAVQTLCRCEPLRALVECVLGANAFATRGVLFDKTPEANWKVRWHQDKMIALRERRETAGFAAWSVKAGVPHAQPPVEVLEKMLSARLHLDDCLEENGPLRVLPGSHLRGILDEEAARDWKESGHAQSVPVPRGAVLLMRPLLLHASSAAIAPRHRRVLHLDFAAADLPNGLEWHRRV